jgi:hypothetical protein
VAILQELARHISHKAEDRFPHIGEVLKVRDKLFIFIEDGKSLVVEL